MTTYSPEVRRQQILEAALPLFATQGFKGTSNRDIARAADITPGLLYHYFKNKEELYRATIEAFTPFAQLGFAVSAARDLPVAELVPMLVGRITQVFTESRRFTQVVRMLIIESLQNPAEGVELNRLMKRFVDPLSAYIAIRIARGDLRPGDPVLMAQSLIGAIIVFFVRRVIGHDEDLAAYALEDFTAFVTMSFLRAYGA